MKKGAEVIPQKKKNFLSPLVHAAGTRLEAGRIFHAGLRKLWLRRADLLRASDTAGPLLVLCHKDQLGMSLLHRHCVQLELCAACGSNS